MSASTAQPQDFLPLTPAQFYILLALAERDLHGYGIMQDVKTRTKKAVSLAPGTLYTALDRMIERGWIEEVAAPNVGDDERRKVYHLTDFGRRMAEAEARRLADTVQDARALGLLKETVQ